MLMVPAAIVPFPIALAITGILVVDLAANRQPTGIWVSLTVFSSAHGMDLFAVGEKKNRRLERFMKEHLQ